MGYWNYRIIFDGTDYWVGEVHYDDSGAPHGYTGPSQGILSWDNLPDLQGTIGKITVDTALSAVLRVNKDTEEIIGDISEEELALLAQAPEDEQHSDSESGVV